MTIFTSLVFSIQFIDEWGEIILFIYQITKTEPYLNHCLRLARYYQKKLIKAVILIFIIINKYRLFLILISIGISHHVFSCDVLHMVYLIFASYISLTTLFFAYQDKFLIARISKWWCKLFAAKTNLNSKLVSLND